MMRFWVRKLVTFLLIVALLNMISYIAVSARSYELFWRLPPNSVTGSPAPKTFGTLLQEYGVYARDVLSGDLGKLRDGKAVFAVILERLPNTLLLQVLSLIASALLGTAAGLLSVNGKTRRTNSFALVVSIAGFSMPSFYLGILVLGIMLWISIARGIPGILLPVSGYGLDEHLILPVLVLAARPTAEIARLTSELLADELTKDYIRTARAKGLPWRLVLLRHAFRNIVATVIVVLGNSLRYLVSSSLVVEWLFLWPGLGQLLVLILVQNSGYLLEPALAAATMTSIAVFFLLATLTTDVAAQTLNPRARRYQHS